MLFMPLLMQLLIGMSMSRYCPATGIAGLLRALVSGNNRVPRPPPRIMHSTDDEVMGESLESPAAWISRDANTLPLRQSDCKQTAGQPCQSPARTASPCSEHVSDRMTRM